MGIACSWISHSGGTLWALLPRLSSVVTGVLWVEAWAGWLASCRLYSNSGPLSSLPTLPLTDWHPPSPSVWGNTLIMTYGHKLLGRAQLWHKFCFEKSLCSSPPGSQTPSCARRPNQTHKGRRNSRMQCPSASCLSGLPTSGPPAGFDASKAAQR